jgi:hypothetical protein
MVDAIEGIGGYSRFNDGSYPVAFNVKAYPDLGFEDLWQHIDGAWTNEGDIPAGFKEFAESLYPEHEDSLFDWGVEDARHCIEESDAYRMLWDGTEIDVTWEFHGRSGGWLIPVEMEGINMGGRELEYWRAKPGTEDFDHAGIDFEDLRKIYRFLCQCQRDFTPEKAAKDVQYQAAFQFFANIVEPAWEDHCEDKAQELETLREWEDDYKDAVGV